MCVRVCMFTYVHLSVWLLFSAVLPHIFIAYNFTFQSTVASAKPAESHQPIFVLLQSLLWLSLDRIRSHKYID